MILTTFSQSIMTLPGKYQPSLEPRWSVDNSEVFNKFIKGRANSNLFNFDPIYMGDGKKYQFRLNLIDKKHH